MTDIERAAAQHALNLATAYEDNCRLKNGIPGPAERLRVGETESRPTVSAPIASPAPAPILSTQEPAAKSDWLKNAVLGTIGLSSLGGLGLGVMNSMRPATTTVIEQPAPSQTQHGSLYQYLQDGGYHVPPSDK
jgi:hypothetical protein